MPIVPNRLVVMPSNATGWFWHCLARETGRVGHLFSPGAERGPWPWFPYALDNGCFNFWDEEDNSFSEDAWKENEPRWRELISWAAMNNQKAIWAIVPDRPGDSDATFRKWSEYAGVVERSGIPLAIAVQNGMTTRDVKKLSPQPEIICVGGSTEWKWETAEKWAKDFSRAHLLRCNSPAKLPLLDKWGYESCDGTGWLRDRIKAGKLEEYLREPRARTSMPLAPHACRGEIRSKIQIDGSFQGSFQFRAE